MHFNIQLKYWQAIMYPGISKQQLNELIKEKYKEISKPIFNQKIYYGQRPAVGSKKSNSLLTMPQEIYTSKITLQMEQGNKNQAPFKHVQDNRVKIHDTLQYPYSSIGLLCMKYGQSWITGSGALIGANYILTCAQNIYIRKSKKQAEEIIFYPACDGKKTFGQGKKVIKRFIMEEYKTCKQQEAYTLDYAILEIQEDISKQFGYFGIDFAYSNYQNKQVTICGYPADKEGNQQKTMWEAKGKIKQNDYQSGQLYYDIPAYAGQSGSPIFIQWGNNYYIIGIHTHGDHKKQMNAGKSIQKVLYDNFNKWIIKKSRILNLKIKYSEDRIGSQGIKHLVSLELPKLNKLDLENNRLGSQGIQHLVSREWPELEELNLQDNQIDAKAIKYLASREWPRLKVLNLARNHLGSQGIKILASREWPRLQVLSLSDNRFGSQGIKNLVSREWPRLQALNLAVNQIGSQGLKYLASREWPGLRVLILTENQIGDQGLKYLASREWSGLQALELSQIKISHEGIKNLASREWPALRMLILSNNQFGSQGIKNLVSREWPRLQALILAGNQIGAQGIKYFTSQKWPKLFGLDLGSNNIGEQGMKNLLSIEWPLLQELKLADNQIGAQGIKYFASQKWPKLQVLDLGDNNIGEQGIKHLLSIEWPRLQGLRLVDNHIDTEKIEQFIEEMKKLLPQLHICL